MRWRRAYHDHCADKPHSSCVDFTTTGPFNHNKHFSIPWDERKLTCSSLSIASSNVHTSTRDSASWLMSHVDTAMAGVIISSSFRPDTCLNVGMGSSDCICQRKATIVASVHSMATWQTWPSRALLWRGWVGGGGGSQQAGPHRPVIRCGNLLVVDWK
jgi:hypothetical protein